jgi:hypothetical protein
MNERINDECAECMSPGSFVTSSLIHICRKEKIALVS